MTAPASSELPAQYDPAATEREIYQRWLDAGVFTPAAADTTAEGAGRPAFVIMMPPPNVTAILHVGHGLNNTVQDVLARWRRMCGDETLWLPGTDHAGIATQNVVERIVAGEGKSRFDLGRDGFVARTASFVDETGGAILRQLQAIGASCDWSRTAYTLSPQLSVAVREAFVRLYEEGLIYRGHRVIHWCPRCLTSLSDEEAEFNDTAGTLYHISYPLTADSSRSLTVATTRPETLLGDVAVAVHPDDERYRDLVGQTVRLPVADLDIPVIADGYTDPAFGTGVVKITPAHDPNDFEVGLRHRLAMPVVIAPDGTMAEGEDARGRVPDALRGADRFEARRQIVEMLRQSGRLVKAEPHPHAVRQCYRCDTVIEPRLSDQWFVRMAPLAAPALAGVRDGRIRILPERWEAVYVNWLEGIRDWNISRQLWWGHRIPVWYCARCGGAPMASREDLHACPTCAGPVTQDEDVLDTWFSSWLWPMSTLGWPDETSPDLRAFFPGDMLVTAPEILFFWVSRMIMSGYHFMGEAPFHTVYLHGTVRDTQHRKMSKSLGNGVDPLDVVRLYGADALRYTLVSKIGMGADVILDPANLEESFAPGRNFATKLWNIGRFLLANVGEDAVLSVAEIPAQRLARADQWILARLDATIADCNAALGPGRPGGETGNDEGWTAETRLSGLRLNEYAEAARRFVWNELADWYLEAIKGRLSSPGEDRDAARAVLVHVFDRALRLLHPIVPFITETLWQRLPGRLPDDLLPVARWPEPGFTHAGANEFELIRNAVSAIRAIRADYNLPPGRQIEATLVPSSDAARTVLAEEAGIIGRLTKSVVTLTTTPPYETAAHSLMADGTELVVPLAGIIDLEKECARLRGELDQLQRQLGALEQRLGNPGFLGRAPSHVVETEQQKQREWVTRRDQLAAKVQSLCGG